MAVFKRGEEMKRIFVLLLCFGFQYSFSATESTQNEDAKYFKIKSYKVAELTEQEVLNMPGLNNTYTPNYVSNCSDDGSKDAEPSNVDLDQVIRWGKEVWKIIQDNKAVVDVESVTVHALPSGIYCWDQLATWQMPNSKYYQVTYENTYGIEVIDVVYRVTYSYGGSFHEKGKYLANVSVAPAKIDVMWGFKFESSVKVPFTLNVGSATDPVAGIELNIHWSVKSLNHSEQSLSLFVDGQGGISQL